MGKYSNSREIDTLVKQLVGEGWKPIKKKRHWQIVPPDGGKPCTIPTTPSDGRAYLNFRCDIKRGREK